MRTSRNRGRQDRKKRFKPLQQPTDRLKLLAFMNILICIESYLPGTLGGGPVRALANLIDHLGEEHEFFIFTRNHDYCDASEYPEIEPNVWHQQPKASVFYTNSQHIGCDMLQQIKVVQPDWIYLNGAFPSLTRALLHLRRKVSEVREIPVLLAPHGNLSDSALAHHRFRKQGWLLYAKCRNMYSEVIWHAASDRESEQIHTIFGAQASIREVAMAPRAEGTWRDRAPLASETVAMPSAISDQSSSVQPIQQSSEPRADHQLSTISHQSSHPSPLRLVYFGRLSPEKNLEFAFQLLQEFAHAHPDCTVIYDLIGSGSDHYERKLRGLAAQLPATVQVNFIGQLSPDALQARLQPSVITDQSSVISHHSSPSPYHALLMPSQTENFSYTVLESLQAGIPVLISDQTPWRGLSSKGIGWDLPLEEKGAWLQALKQLAKNDESERAIRRQQAIDYAHQHTAEYTNKAKQLFAEISKSFR